MARMSRHLEIVEKGRAAVLAGDVEQEEPPRAERGRWGISMLLRPSMPMLTRLSLLAQELNTAAGGGHWAHGPVLLHASLKALEVYRGAPPADDPAVAAYTAALSRAVQGIPPIRATVKTISPHSFGVAVHVHPHGDALDLLYRRLGAALAESGEPVFEYWVRDVWYINVLHFAAPVSVEPLVAYCDANRDVVFGETTFDAAELVSYAFDGTSMRAITLHKAQLLA
jgi:hypothetical protein